MEQTIQEYELAMVKCKDIFIKKMKDYGCAWRILRLSSLTDQIFIKAQRIRSIEMNDGHQKVGEDIRNEFIGIVNYSIIALIQLEKGIAEQPDMETEEVEVLYNKLAQEANELMQAKNYDYGEAWRDMRVSSLTDLILQKLLRVKQIEDNKGKTLISEGIDANYFDMINYAICLLYTSPSPRDRTRSRMPSSA